jgi:predicted phage terminase large subunit-like protein
MNATLRVDGMDLDIARTIFEIERADAEESLAEFIRQAWPIVEPSMPYGHGWHIDLMCEHLEAITNGEMTADGKLYNRLLINVPPGMMKSLLVGVFWQAWEWGPKNMPGMRYVCAAHSQELAVRDGLRMRRLIESEWYQARWGDRVRLTKDQNQKTKFENTATGFRQAIAAGSITGARGDRVVIDDPHSVEGAPSDQMRQTTIEWFREAVPTRLNDPERSAIVVIMQRLHEEDVSGVILDGKFDYDHICLPMRFEAWRKDLPTKLGIVDPRQEEGELLFPLRFPLHVVERDEAAMGPYAVAGQFQQTPSPRGGGIIKREWWQPWEHEQYPQLQYVIASLDTAYTTKQENDLSALTIWGIFSQAPVATADHQQITNGARLDAGRSFAHALPRVMLMYAWQERIEIHELVQKTAVSCKRFKVDKLLIESKAAGISVAQELRRLYGLEDFSVQLVEPGNQDKMARLYAVQHIFADQMVYAPERQWADQVINQCAQFPRGKHDDLVDTVSQALGYLRKTSMLQRAPEAREDLHQSMLHQSRPSVPLYPGVG